jgi:homocitrate synthase NifV
VPRGDRDVQAALPTGLRHYNLSISTSDQMIQNKFRGRLDRCDHQRWSPRWAPRAAGVATIGVNAEDGSAPMTAHRVRWRRDAGADRVRYCDTIGGDTPTGSGSGSPSWAATASQ